MTIKKSVFVTSLVVSSLLFGAIGAVASTGVEKIKAALNHNIKFVLDGAKWTPKDSDGNKLSALVYDGSTYVPLRAVSEALDAELDWDNDTSTITINRDGGNIGIPHKDDTDKSNSGGKESNSNNNSNSNSGNSGSSKDDSNSKPTPSTASGKTMDNAIPIGKSITYSDPYSYKGQSYRADYTISVSSAKSISRDQIKDLGFKRPEENAEVDYKLVKLKVIMKNGKYISEGTFGYAYASTLFTPNIWGSKAKDGTYIIGETDYGFKGSLSDAISDQTGFKKLHAGDTASYSAEGLVILPVVKGQTNYLTLQTKNTDDYDNSFIYFELE